MACEAAACSWTCLVRRSGCGEKRMRGIKQKAKQCKDLKNKNNIGTRKMGS